MNKILRIIFGIVVAFMPMVIKRIAYRHIFGFIIHNEAYIGFSLVVPDQLVIRDGARIGHLNVIKGVKSVCLDECATLGNLNWISGFPLIQNLEKSSGHFSDQSDRNPSLQLGAHSAITHRHLIDCTDSVTIGRFTTFAGYRSQILSHAIDLQDSRQRSAPVSIGEYCFVGTNVVILPGARLPNHCVLGASACLTKSFSDEYMLYAGVPSKPVKKLPSDMGYFKRNQGFVL